MRLQARAKINWTLDVIGKRRDGYHLLQSIMQPLELSDVLTVETADTLTLQCLPPLDGCDNEHNLVIKAARALQAASGINRGAAIRLEKRIPTGAGLGGGSADAAAVLKALNILWDIGFSLQKLQKIGLSVGADVPFCLYDAPAVTEGIGEVITPLTGIPHLPVVLLRSCSTLSTGDIFGALSAGDYSVSNLSACADALRRLDFSYLRTCSQNTLEKVSVRKSPDILRATQDLYEHGAAFARMTGSGSVVFGVFESSAAADAAFERLRQSYPCCIRTATSL